ncbi:hypothetical protein V8B97DRAFT_1872110 [Scleroderma yunnanense]
MADNPLPDPSIYDAQVDGETRGLMKSMTGIQDENKLKEHILDVRARASTVAPYPCVTSLNFLRRKMSDHLAYQQVLKLGRERAGALLLEMGCCFGMELRRVVADGFPARQIIASDLNAELWEFGHTLCRSTPESFPVTFLAGDALDPDFLSPIPCDVETQAPFDVSRISTLTGLKGKCSAIYARSFFHLFNEAQQCQIAHALGSLLSPEKGSVIFGSHIGGSEKGSISHKTIAGQERTFLHSPSSWKELWSKTSSTNHPDGVAQRKGNLEQPVFRFGEVRVEASIKFVRSPLGLDGYRLDWCVTRL